MKHNLETLTKNFTYAELELLKIELRERLKWIHENTVGGLRQEAEFYGEERIIEEPLRK